MTKSNSYQRARYEFFKAKIKISDKDKLDHYSNGVFYNPKLDKEWLEFRHIDISNDPLSFRELSSFNTYFDMYPEQVAGKEFKSTSLHFKFQVKGTEKDVEKVFKNSLGALYKTSEERKKILIAKAKMKMHKHKLALLKLRK